MAKRRKSSAGWFAAQRGPADFIERYSHYLPSAVLSKPVYAETEGIVTAMDTRALGMAVVSLAADAVRPRPD